MKERRSRRATMLNHLPKEVKISVTRSISSAFEKYMESIQWDEQKYAMDKFLAYWREYAEKHASWFHQLDDAVKRDPRFHKELADKINEVIGKILNEPPTEQEIKTLNGLIDRLGIADIDYTCKMEAKYHIRRLTEQEHLPHGSCK
ncbi:hypothetical protein B1691_15555 [Geobacillus sp. 47C-IIb]|uniref:Group-specific protein n=2 Tax=Anoxybacillaceae TaxID=3120669 RepID=A4ISZ4_GEOTN|nr:Conserved hypothetical protein [Geobacillus thermodenitrificans NG80-2]OQP08398.1 hypothetical protein B1691_15555 [Geobacillus sp. 47C-IIb]